MPLGPDILSELIKRHWGPLLAWVGPRNAFCGYHDGEFPVSGNAFAEDVVQQTFIKLASLDEPPGNVAAWLYTVSRNEARNETLYAQRRQRRQHRAAGQERVSDESVWASAEASELAETLSQLPDDLRQVVVAKIWGDLTFDEIANLLGCSKATVWRRYEAALNLLRKTYGVPCPTKT